MYTKSIVSAVIAASILLTSAAAHAAVAVDGEQLQPASPLLNTPADPAVYYKQLMEARRL